jgi:ethanolamine utilization protein EutP (predicted NTPase)
VKKIMAFCGVNCTKCPVYIATQNKDDEARKQVAHKWSSPDEPLTPEDLDCDGCLVVGKKLYRFCATCEVRMCGFKKNVETCAHCDEYPCEKLNAHWEKENVIGIERTGEEWGNRAKANLEEIRKNH